jgi:hypothetical protein
MLGQHPECYGLPELNLFVADDLAGAWRWMERLMPHGQDGLLRVLAEIEEGEQTQASVDRARVWVGQHGAWTPRQVLTHIQERVGPKLLVEKSPATVFNSRALQRMREAFPNADYLHLIRHPYSTGRSLSSLAEQSAEWNGRLSRLQMDTEELWLRTHKNIINFASALPIGQCMRIKSESMLSNPWLYLPQIAEWLGISTAADAIEAMMHPERSPYARPGPNQAMYGNDPDFIHNPVLNLDRLRAIREPTLANGVGSNGYKEPLAETRKYALQFGYL